MDGAQDMGGVHGFGRVQPETSEPVFHAEWERRAFALTLAMARPGGWNIDQSRFARENRSHADYLSKSYYELWIAGLERLMDERDLVRPDEIAAGRVLHLPKDVAALPADEVTGMLQKGAPTRRDPTEPAQFEVGARVRAKKIVPSGHTRLPRYVRGHVGVVALVHGCHVFPDSNASGAGENPQWLYTVQFTARELWGDDADPAAMFSVDAWQSYLVPA